MTKILTAREVADLMAVDLSTVIRWAQTGRLAAQKAPGQTGAYQFEPAAVDALIAEQSAEAEARAARLREAAS
jgi:excisionase family DNA binding protein